MSNFPNATAIVKQSERTRDLWLVKKYCHGVDFGKALKKKSLVFFRPLELQWPDVAELILLCSEINKNTHSLHGFIWQYQASTAAQVKNI